MQRLLLLGCVWFISSACVSAEVITNRVSIDHATSAMKGASYTQTGLDMMPRAGEDLRFWSVDRGVLIIRYSTKSQTVVGLTFWLSDGRPKASRETFEFEVTSFDTDTGAMTIRTTKGEPDGAANGSQPIRSVTNSTSPAAGSRR